MADLTTIKIKELIETQSVATTDYMVLEKPTGTYKCEARYLKGATGVTPNVTVGNTTTLDVGQPATVVRRGSSENPVFDFGIPRGIQGPIGPKGETPDITPLKNEIDDRFSELTSKQQQDSEVVDARNGLPSLRARLDVTDSKLDNIIKTRFGNKKYVAIGDSITVGFVDKPYATLVGEVFGMNVVNMGVSGSSITVSNDRDDSMYERRNNIPEDANLISIFGGTNDFGHNRYIGKSGSTSFYELYGAFRMMIEWIQQNRPNATLFCITPFHREGDQTENSNGYVLEDYVNVIRDVCEDYGVPVLDLFKLGEINPNIPKQKELFAPDGLHPIQIVHDIIGKYRIPNFIRGL